MCDKFEQKNVFYLCTVPFLVFFALFAAIIYPNVGVLHPHALIDTIAGVLPTGFAAPLSMIRNWSYTIFYVFVDRTLAWVMVKMVVPVIEETVSGFTVGRELSGG